VNVQECDKM